MFIVFLYKNMYLSSNWNVRSGCQHTRLILDGAVVFRKVFLIPNELTSSTGPTAFERYLRSWSVLDGFMTLPWIILMLHTFYEFVSSQPMYVSIYVLTSAVASQVYVESGVKHRWQKRPQMKLPQVLNSHFLATSTICRSTKMLSLCAQVAVICAGTIGIVSAKPSSESQMKGAFFGAVIADVMKHLRTIVCVPSDFPCAPPNAVLPSKCKTSSCITWLVLCLGVCACLHLKGLSLLKYVIKGSKWTCPVCSSACSQTL